MIKKYMKRILSIIAVLTLVLAGTPPALAAKTFGVTYTDTPIEQVIADLHKRSGYEFVYQKDVLNNVSDVTATYKNMTLEQILNRIFVEDLDIAYEIVDKTVILSKPKKNYLTTNDRSREW